MSISTQITVVATAEQIIVTAPGALRGPIGPAGPEGDVTPEVTQLVEDAQAAANEADSAKDIAQQSAALSEGFKADAETAAETAVAQLAPVTEQAGLATEAANRADSSASMAAAFNNPALSIAEGLAVTSGSGSTNRFFSVFGSGESLATAYRNDAGVATPIGQSPSVLAVDQVKANTAAARISVNLANIHAPDILVNFRPNNTTGAPLAAAGYNTSGYIPVAAGSAYSLSSRDYLAWYNSSKVFISGTNNSVTPVTVTAPAGAAFLRVSAKVSAPDLWSGLQVELGSSPTMFEPFGKFIKPEEVKTLSGTLLDAKSVGISASSFIAASKNLFNKYSATLGVFIDSTTGVVTASATLSASDYIGITPGQTYYGSGVNPTRFHCFYDAQKNFVKGGSNSSTVTFTAPATAAFVRITIFTVDLDRFQLEVGSVATSFANYGGKLRDPTGAPLTAMPGIGDISTLMLADQSVSQPKTNFLKSGKNLFNKSAATLGFFINPLSGALTASGTLDTSALIKVVEGAPYKTSYGIRFSCYFAENGTTVVPGGINDNTQATNSFTPPAGAVYVRITFAHANIEAYQLEAGLVTTGFEPYGWKVLGPNGEALIIEGGGGSAGAWSGKSWGTLGDSTSAQAKWQPYVIAGLGLVFTNFGVSGTKVSGPPGDLNAMCQDARINAIPTTTDVLSFLGGLNDWVQNVAMGAPGSADPLTFNGALNTMIEKLTARFPDKRIVLMTTTYGEMPGSVASQGWPNAYTNLIGLTSRDYAEAIRGACKRWSLPCIDVNTDAGWNTINIRTFITDDGGLLHPNDAGGKRIAEVVIGGLGLISPV